MSDYNPETPNLKTSQSGLLKQSLTALKNSKSLKSLQRTVKECPLNDKSIGVIAENDHRVGLCLCPLCTCGAHKCPGPISLEPYPKSMYSSSYHQNFQKHKDAKRQPFKSQPKFYSNQPIDFETTTEQYYKPITQQPVLSLPAYKPNHEPHMGLSGLTSYSANFPDWGTGGVYFVKQSHIRHTNENSKLNSKTSYGETFRPLDYIDFKLASNSGKDFSSNRANIGIKCGSIQAVKESVTKRDFVDWSKQSLTVRAQKPIDNLIKQIVTEDHYLTSAKNDFKRTEAPIDHRNLRKRLEREGIISQEFR